MQAIETHRLLSCSTALASLLFAVHAAGAALMETARRDANALTVLAEIALERGDCKSAAESYATVVARGSLSLARRASEVALACEHMPAAWASAQRWRALAPDDLDAAAVYAIIALKLHRIPEAQAAIGTVLKVAGAQSDTKLAELTALLIEEAEAPAVFAAVNGALEPDKASSETLALLAQLAFDAYDLRRAEHFARGALARNPQSFEAQSLLARIHATRGEGLNAIAAARAAMRVDPKRGMFELVDALAALERFEEARQELERLRTADVAAGEIDRRLALLAFESGDLEDAQHRFAQLAASGAGGEAPLFYLADIAAREGDAEAALAGYKRLFDSSIAVAARTRAAALLLERDDRAEALTLLDDYAVNHPESGFELLIAKALLLSEHGENDGGLALLEAALERHPRHPAIEYHRAVLLERAGNVRESVAAMERLLAERGEDPTLLNAAGYTLADHGMQLARAEGMIRRALAITPDSPAVIDSLGWVRLKRGDARGAVTLLERAYRLGRDAEIAAHWGEALWKSGAKQEARKVWAAALARDPDSPALQNAVGRFVPPDKP